MATEPTLGGARRASDPPGTPRPRARTEAGFTIVEMVIVVVIAAILAALAAPQLGLFIKNNARATRINSMVSALNLARSEAVKLNRAVTVCPSGAGGDFTACNVAGGQLEDGWIVFVDVDRDVTVDADDTVVRVFESDMNEDDDRSTPPNLRLLAQPGGAAVPGFTYRGNGFPANAAGDTHVVYCDDRGAEGAGAIVFTTTGQPRMARDTDDDPDDIPEVGENNLQCP